MTEPKRNRFGKVITPANGGRQPTGPAADHQEADASRSPGIADTKQFTDDELDALTDPTGNSALGIRN